ncbi:hypothetical protein lerEdw1_010261 [Lerista edwardsae]|nr:hypothetical protein lerEdw1_010261 [Lerista edwardsae]
MQDLRVEEEEEVVVVVVVVSPVATEPSCSRILFFGNQQEKPKYQRPSETPPPPTLDQGTAALCSPLPSSSLRICPGLMVKAIFVDSSLKESEWKRYEIQTTKVFKGSPAMQDLRFVYTPTQESACGYTKDPTPGEEYLVAGMLLRNHASIYTCSLTQPWSALSPEQQRGIRRYYKKGCRCSIKSNFHCTWDGDLSGIQAKSLACLPKSGTRGLCTWQSLNSQRSGSFHKSSLKQ